MKFPDEQPGNQLSFFQHPMSMDMDQHIIPMKKPIANRSALLNIFCKEKWFPKPTEAFWHYQTFVALQAPRRHAVEPLLTNCKHHFIAF